MYYLGIVIVQVLFRIYLVCRDEAFVYTWMPWTEKDYVLFKKVPGNNRQVKVRLLIIYIAWPFIFLFSLVMPIVFLFMLPGILKEYKVNLTTP